MTTEVTDEELLARFPGWPVDRDSQAIYRGWLNRQLLVNRCDDCGVWHTPPKPACPSCWSWNVTATRVAGTGTIFMYVLLYQGPPAEGVDYATPHPVVTVELDEQLGLRLTTVVGSPNEDIHIGARVEVDWIERDGAPMPVFRLTGQEA